ncbi:MAG: ABC transporter substrate-binding protein [Thermoguttaceae bacterium]|nr:ABC transporter substrate-binding protein [Thermoguttaceae bacterium]
MAILFALLFLVPQLLWGQDDDAYRIRMLWLPQAEFAGFYRAQADHLYDKAGVKVVLEHPRPEEELFDTLVKKRCDLIVAWPIPAVKRAAAGDDIVHVGQMSQDSALLFIARKRSGITKPQDITGHRVGFWMAPSLQAPFLAFLSHYGVSSYKSLPVFVNVDLFLYGGVDVTVGTFYDEYYRLFGHGIDASELVCFDLNTAFPALVDDGLYCLRSTWEKNPEAIEKIRAATMEGWRRACADKRNTLNLVQAECQKAGLPFNLAHQRWMLNVMEEQIFPKNKKCPEKLTREAFDEITQILHLKKGTLSYGRFVPDSLRTRSSEGQQ